MTTQERIAAVLREALDSPECDVGQLALAIPREVRAYRKKLSRELAARVAAIPGLTIASKAVDSPLPCDPDAEPMSVDEVNSEIGTRTPIEWDDSSPDPWKTKPK